VLSGAVTDRPSYDLFRLGTPKLTPKCLLCAHYHRFPPSRSPTCIGSHRLSSNGRASGDGRCFAEQLECVACVRNASSLELRE
jgi:hypothetical protein